MTHYCVSTPELYHGYGYDEPPEYFVEFVFVDAPDKRTAKIEAVRKMRETPTNFVWITNGDNPFTGLRVEEPRCEHGWCYCDICFADPNYDECGECLEDDEWTPS
jgi:hypothetical protein